LLATNSYSQYLEIWLWPH